MKKKLLFFCMIQWFIPHLTFSQGLPLPYFTGFDSPSEQAGWQQYRTGFISNYAWGFSGGGFNAQCVSHDYNVGGNPTDTVVDWFVSPPLNFTTTGTMALKVRTSGFSTPFPDSFEILFGTYTQDPSAGNFTVIANLSFMQPQFQWLDTVIDIPFVSDSGYIALKYKTIGAAWSTYAFDNIEISASPVSVPEKVLRNSVLNCFPNPFTMATTIHLSDGLAKSFLQIRLLDVYGNELRRYLPGVSNTILLTREGLPAGIYLLNVELDSKIVQTEKLIISGN
ncbi:MAG TPA: choice-of-anchor J domain-containing protein [Bacteroidia bacterium]|nr:choice-of-anchor J domain-containing protein [Bacteroidia bacterium]